MAIILGIETSCDETGIAIYCSIKKQLLADNLYSQIELHCQYGGVVPELASRDHIRKIGLLIRECLSQANLTIDEIDAIAYTNGPGLNGALLIGAGVANGLAFILAKPVIPIHHLEGHILSAFLSDDIPQLPFLSLLVSGGHSQIIAVREFGQYEIIGDTLDDAAGEAFDKTAKMLGLPYPGGKYIAQLATKGQDIYNLPRPMLHSKNLDMSFSGLKTAVLDLITKLGGLANLSLEIKQNIAKSIEEAITDTLKKKIELAVKIADINNIVVSGGVSANLTLRSKLSQIANCNIYYPPLKYCTDNGAMIAIAGAFRFNNHMAQNNDENSINYQFKVKPRYPLNSLESINKDVR
jgi:N6-L-threonylcarbamoyladenine synthase